MAPQQTNQNSVKNVIAKVSSDVAERLGWSNSSNRKLIRACFFLGYGTTYIQELVNNPIRSEEADALVGMAEVLGMSDNDDLEVYEHETNRALQRGRGPSS